MIRPPAAEVARALNCSPARLISGGVSSLARTLRSGFGKRLPYRVSRKLDQLALRGVEIIVHSSAIITAKSGKRALLVGHDLSLSGAPILLNEIAFILRDKGWHVTLISPIEGALLDQLIEGKIDVLISPSIGLTTPLAWAHLAKTVDVAICNTVVTREAVDALSGLCPCLWYLHEVSLIEALLASDSSLPNAFAAPQALWAGSEISAKIVRRYRSDIRVVPYGLQSLANDSERAPGSDTDRPLRIVLLGSYEARKGQDLLLYALQLLPDNIAQQCQVAMFGRILDQEFYDRLYSNASKVECLSLNSQLTTEQYNSEVLNCDAVIVASRDDTLPLVSLDALGAGRVLMCTPTTGTSSYLQSGLNGFVASEASAEAIGSMLISAIGHRASWPTVGARGAEVFKTHFSRHSFEAILTEQLENMICLKAAQP